MRGDNHIKQEVNNNYFEIHKSVDGESWNLLGTVQATGNSYENQSYYLQDVSPVKGINYYRLSQTDFDGQIADLGMRFVIVKGVEMEINVYPNPTDGEITISNIPEGQGATITVVDMLGKVVYENTISTKEFKLQIPGASGIYHISIVSGNAQYSTKVSKF